MGSAHESSHPDHRTSGVAKVFEETAHRADFEIVERWIVEDGHIQAVMLALRADLEDDFAVLLGFADAGHFSKISGSTPSRYRAGL